MAFSFIFLVVHSTSPIIEGNFNKILKENREMKKLVKNIMALALMMLMVVGNANAVHVDYATEGLYGVDFRELDTRRAKYVCCWLTERNGLDWDNALLQLEEILQQDYNELTLISKHYSMNSEKERCDSVKFTYETEYGNVVEAEIINHM